MKSVDAERIDDLPHPVLMLDIERKALYSGVQRLRHSGPQVATVGFYISDAVRPSLNPPAQIGISNQGRLGSAMGCNQVGAAHLI